MDVLVKVARKVGRNEWVQGARDRLGADPIKSVQLLLAGLCVTGDHRVQTQTSLPCHCTNK